MLDEMVGKFRDFVLVWDKFMGIGFEATICVIFVTAAVDICNANSEDNWVSKYSVFLLLLFSSDLIHKAIANCFYFIFIFFLWARVRIYIFLGKFIGFISEGFFWWTRILIFLT